MQLLKLQFNTSEFIVAQILQMDVTFRWACGSQK
jgi:hypothetical protein